MVRSSPLRRFLPLVASLVFLLGLALALQTLTAPVLATDLPREITIAGQDGPSASAVVSYTIQGIVDEQGVGPVQDAWVMAEPGGYSALTDARGAYTLTVNVARETVFTLTAVKAGYVSPASQTVTVQPYHTGVNFSFPHRFQVAGKVRDYDHTPVQGVWVSASPAGTGNWTDATGAYTLMLVSGSYTVTASKDGYPNPPPRVINVTADATGIDFTFAQRYTLGGTVRDHNLQALQGVMLTLQPDGTSVYSDLFGLYSFRVVSGTYTVHASKTSWPSPEPRTVSVPPDCTDVDLVFPQLYTVRGTALDYDNTPMPRVSITAFPGGLGTQTDASGAYTLSLAAGTYTLHAYQPGLPDPPAQVVTVPPDRTGIDFVFPQRYTISGSVRDAHSSVLQDALVSASPAGSSAWTNASGVYTLTVTAGAYSLRVTKGMLLSPPDRQVTVPPSQTGVDFTFPEAYTISGVVRDPDGNPVFSAMISASPGSYTAWTDSSGTYTLTVTGGTYVVRATKYGYPDPNAQTVTVPPSRTDVNFTFPRTYIIAGLVREGGVTPMSGVQVEYSGPASGSTFTDGNGAYSITVVAGTYQMRAVKFDYPTLPAQTVTVPPSHTDVHFDFPARSIIAGTVRDFDGSPMRDVLVSASPGSASARTDAGGAYSLSVQAGTYTISVWKEGYPAPAAQMVTVPPNRMDLGFTFPQRFQIAGSVREFDRRPVPDASVTGYGPTSSNSSTDARGAYTLTVVAGSYTVSAAKSGYPYLPPQSVTVPPSRSDVHFTFPQRFTIGGVVRNYNGQRMAEVLVSAQPDGASTLTDASGSYSLTVLAGIYTVSAYKYGYPTPAPLVVSVPPSRMDANFVFPQPHTVSGLVRDFDGTPVPEAWVVASPGGYVASTDARGAYTLTLLPGTYSVSASKQGYPDPPVQTVSVPPSRSDVHFTFPQRFTIAGVVRDGSGNPVQGAWVSASPGSQGTWTDAEGRYALTVVAATYSISAAKSGYPTAPAQSVTVPPSRSDVNFTFTAYTIGGTVRDSAGSPVQGATVTTSPGFFTAVTDARGVYTFTLGAGTYSVSVHKTGYPDPAPQTVTVPPSRTDVDFHFAAYHTIAGLVRDFDGTPVQGATVYASPGFHSALTDASGAYTLTVLAGTYNVSVSRPGYPNLPTQTVTVPPSRADVHFTYPQRYAVSGVVTDSASAPVVGATVTCIGPESVSTSTDAQGAYSLSVTAGRYVVRASKFGYPNVPAQEVTVPPSRSDVNFSFPATYTVSGTVRDYDGTPMPVVLVAAAPGSHSSSTDATGAYTLTLPAGTYTISAIKSGYPGPAPQSVMVPPSRSGVDFTFPQRYSICVSVRWPDGSPVPDAFAGLCEGDVWVQTDATGRACFSVGAGTYQICAFLTGLPSPSPQSATVPPSANVEFTLVQRYTISGRVTDFGGAPVDDVWVSAYPGGFGAMSDANGIFTLTVVAGTYSISISKYGYQSPPAQSVSVPPSRSGVNLRFLQTYAVNGTVRDFDGSPVRDASILASPGGFGTSTDATGAYVLHLPAGSYSLSAYKESLPGLPARAVTVPPSQSGIDFQFPQRFTISGTVIGADGSPVQGASVYASPGGYSALSDASGGYLLTVAASSYSVSVSKYPLASPPAQTVVVPPSRTGVNFAFQQTYLIAGRVSDFDGTPILGAVIGASPGGYATTSDSSGAYSLTMAAGTYEVRATKSGYPTPPAQTVSVPPSHTDINFRFSQQALIGGKARDFLGNPVQGAIVSASPGNHSTGTDASGAYTLTVTAGTYTLSASKACLPNPPTQTATVPPDRTDVDWTFGQTYPISGSVREFDGAPVPGARVSSAPGGCWTETDASGAYTLNLGSGTYDISVSKQGYLSLPLRTVSVPPERSGIDFVFPQRNIIGGTVRDFDGTPTADVLVSASPGSYSTLSDASGVYTLTVSPGTYSVSASKPGYPSPQPQSVTVPPNRTDVNLTFPQRNIISGLVRSFEGSPIEGAFVAASPGNYSALTDSTGRYTLRVTPGTYSVNVSKVGYSSPPAQTVTVPPDRADVDFTFLQAYMIGGRVRDFDGSPVADVAINASPGGYAATSNAAGLYTLTVPSGTYDVSAVKPGYPILPSQRVTVPPSRMDIHFNFPQRATIGGTVRDGEGNPVRDVLVSASPGGYLAFTDASGHYTLNVVAGTYVVTVSKTGYPSPPGRTISVPPSRDDLDFSFLETYVVSGAVREFDGTPVPNVDVMASPGAHITRTDPAGAYTLNLSSGTYSVSISKAGYPALPPRTVTVPPSQTQVDFGYPQRFSISGSVRDFDGTSVVEAVVTANPGGYSTLTDAQGAYGLSVVAGTYQVRASKTGYQIPPEQTVTVPPSRSNVDFTFPERLTLGGTVRDFDGSPLQGALVSANSGGYVGSSDAHGVYTITLLAGTYTVTVSMGGYPPPDGRVVTLPPSQRDVDFVFPQRYRISGHARDDAGMPLADVIISTRPGSFITSTDASGAYAMYVLAGTYTLTASKPGYPSPPTQSITVPPERDDVDWVFPRRFLLFLPYIARGSRR